MSPLSIHGKEYTVGKIFSDEFDFTIPYYQRPYAWTTEHAGELFEDLVTDLRRGEYESVDDMSPYFLGSIVLVKDEGDPKSAVVDGQQRLTTLTLLLSALRETIEGKQADDITPFLYEEGNEMLGTQNRYRLQVRDSDCDFFRTYCQEPGGLTRLDEVDEGQLNDSEKNMATNGAFLLKKVEELPEETCVRLTRYILKNCIMVVVSSQDRESAYRIFSILNDRGLDLYDCDILKADIIGDIADSHKREYAKEWERTEEDLGREAFNDLFAHVRMIYRKAKLRSTIVKEFKESVLGQLSACDTLDQVIFPFANAYSEILTTSYEGTSKSEEINELLGWLNRIDNVDWLPPAILRVKNDHGNPVELCHFLRDLERLAAGMMILRTYRTSRINRYARVLKAMDHGRDLYAEESPLQLTEDETSEIKAALDGPIYQLRNVPQYVLLRVDSVMSGAGARYDYKTISIEHVLPQTPADDSHWLDEFSNEEERQELTHKLGNLVLLSRRKNRDAWNYDFEKKKDTYFTETNDGISPFVITTQVIRESSWTPAVVRQRQETILNKLKDLWRL